MRPFQYITVGKILNELWEEARKAGVDEEYLWKLDTSGKKIKKYPITRITFVRLEEKAKIPRPQRTSGKWRVYSREEADIVKQKIKDNYNMLQS